MPFVLAIILDYNWCLPTFKEQIQLFVFEEVTGFEWRRGRNFPSRATEIAAKWVHLFLIFRDRAAWSPVPHTFDRATFEALCTVSHSARDVRDGKDLLLEHSSKTEVCLDKFKAVRRRLAAISRGPATKKRPHILVFRVVGKDKPNTMKATLLGKAGCHEENEKNK